MGIAAKVWVTYSWDDNLEGDVDFFAQELKTAGLEVHLDRWDISAGSRLWQQIEKFIQDPSKSDGWILYATQNSLQSEACQEEFAYALDRAIRGRGEAFPVIGVFPASVDGALIPAGIRTRLFVSLSDPDWVERIKAAAEKRPLSITTHQLDPYYLKVHHIAKSPSQRFAIELRPRAGTWSPFIAALPMSEKPSAEPVLLFGPRGRVPTGSALFNTAEGTTADLQWWAMTASNEATPTQSYYVMVSSLPSKIRFGVDNSKAQYTVVLPLRDSLQADA